MNDKIVCECFNVSEEDIINAIKNNNLTTLSEVSKHTKAGLGGKNCKGNQNAT